MGRDLVDWGPGGEHRDAAPASPPDIYHADGVAVGIPSEVSGTGDLIAGVTPQQAEAAIQTLEQIADENADLALLEHDLEELSEGCRAAIARAIARKPHARRDALLNAIADQFTLEQAVEFKAWHANLPDDKRRLLLEWAADGVSST